METSDGEEREEMETSDGERRGKRWRQVMMEERKEMETSDDGGEGRDGEEGRG